MFHTPAIMKSYCSLKLQHCIAVIAMCGSRRTDRVFTVMLFHLCVNYASSCDNQ